MRTKINIKEGTISFEVGYEGCQWETYKLSQLGDADMDPRDHMPYKVTKDEDGNLIIEAITPGPKFY